MRNPVQILSDAVMYKSIKSTTTWETTSNNLLLLNSQKENTSWHYPYSLSQPVQFFTSISVRLRHFSLTTSTLPIARLIFLWFSGKLTVLLMMGRLWLLIPIIISPILWAWKMLSWQHKKLNHDDICLGFDLVIFSSKNNLVYF